MQLKEYLQELYEYNYWANKRYLAVAETLTEEQLFRKQGHSWDSVHAVLVHMMSSERMWPQRWRGETGTFLDPKDFPTMASLREFWVDVERNMREFIAGQTEESLQRAVTFTNPKGETFTLPLWQMMVQPPNHNTHHRGELAAMFALMNVPHPEEEIVPRAAPAAGCPALRPRARAQGIWLGSRRARLMTSEPLRALLPIIEVLRALDVPYAIGGSMASSVFGEPRSTADIDILVELRAHHITEFVAALTPSFYVDEDAVRDAIRRRASFNILHQDSVCKVDIFVASDDLLDREQLARRRSVSILGDSERVFDVTAPEIIVLRKLSWYRSGGDVSQGAA